MMSTGLTIHASMCTDKVDLCSKRYLMIYRDETMVMLEGEFDNPTIRESRVLKD